MVFRLIEEEMAKDGAGSDQYERHRPNARHSSRDYSNQGMRRSRPIAIPHTTGAEEPEERAFRPEAMSLPAASLHAPLLGSSLPASRPPPFQLSDAADAPHPLEASVPYGSLRDHRRQERFGTSVPNPRGNDLSGLSIADRIRGASKPSKSTSSPQISSLTRMMEEAVKISSSSDVPRSPGLGRKRVQVQQQQLAEPNLSSSLTGLQVLQNRGLPSLARTPSARSSDLRESIHDEPEDGAFELDLE